jgi:cytoskeletal protein RodZ
MDWLKTHWKATLAGIAAFFIGGAVGVSGAQDEARTKTVTDTQVVHRTRTEVKVKRVPKVVYRTRYRTKTVTAPAATDTASATPAADVPSRQYSGNGGKTLGDLDFPRGTTMTWTNDGAIFQVLDDGSDVVPVNSQAHSGSTVLNGGSYPNFQVNAVGNWTITLGTP